MKLLFLLEGNPVKARLTGQVKSRWQADSVASAAENKLAEKSSSNGRQSVGDDSKPHYLRRRRGCAFVRLRYKRQQNARSTTSRVPSRRRTCWLDAPGSQLTRGIRSQHGSAVSTARPAPACTARPPASSL